MSSPPTTKRVRRTPDQARKLILDTTLAQVAERGPQDIGLKDIAKAAGISHGLVSHYFGTLENLIEEAFSLHIRGMRETMLVRLRQDPVDSVASWVDHLFAIVTHPLHGRLIAWSLITGRAADPDFITRREGGLGTAAAILASRFPEVPRESIDYAVVFAVSTAVGYSTAGDIFWDSIGQTITDARSAELRRLLSDALHALFAGETSS